jgi:hypothetical protein
LIEGIDVLAQEIAQGYRGPAYFLPVACHIGKNNA